MEVKGLLGSVAGLPVRGVYANFGAASTAGIVGAVAGLTKTLVLGAGALGLAAAFLGLLDAETGGESKERGLPRKRIPLSSSLSLCRCPDFRVCGFCLEDNLSFKIDRARGKSDKVRRGGQRISLSLDTVTYLNYPDYRLHPDSSYIELIDGSCFTLNSESYDPPALRFATLAGVLLIDLRQEHEIIPALPSQLKILKEDLETAIRSKLSDVVDILGREVTERYFKINENGKLLVSIQPMDGARESKQ